jgi:hypothetical protein
MVSEGREGDASEVDIVPLLEYSDTFWGGDAIPAVSCGGE